MTREGLKQLKVTIHTANTYCPFWTFKGSHNPSTPLGVQSPRWQAPM